MSAGAQPTTRATLLDSVLRPFGEVRSGEGVVTALMLASVFLILTSCYVLKTAREGLILTGHTFGLKGGELKAYANGAIALLLIAVVPAYGALAGRVPRRHLVNVSYAIVIACLIAFFALAHAGASIGLAFFLWFGIVSVLLIAQFWSYANDVYSEEQGKRLFAIIAVGGSVGAICGPWIAELADTYTLLAVAGGLLVIGAAVFNLIEHLHSRRASPDDVGKLPIAGPGGFELVFRDRYLLSIGVLLFVVNVVSTTGEYILSSAAADHAARVVPSTAYAELSGAARSAAINADRRELIKEFFAGFFFWVNLLAFAIQAGVVSRLIQRCGVRRALFALPIVALGAYTAIGAIGGLALVQIAKIAENGTDYSVQNTVHATLFLPTTRAAKYKAKAAIDSFFVRAGDTTAALLVAFGIHHLGFGGRGFAAINIGLVAVWIRIASEVAHRHGALEATRTRRGS